MAYLKELMLISYLLAFAMAVTDTAVKMTASPEEIRPLLTRNLDLKCAFDDREGDDRVLFVRMSRQSAAGRPVKELVSMNENSEIQVSNPSTDVRYSGEIFGKGKAYLSGEWHVVPEGLGGIYECKVTVIGRRGETVEHIGVVRVKEETVSLGDVVEKLEKSEERLELTMKFTQTDTFRDNYYLIYQYEVNSASQAEKLCQLRGGYLAELNDYDEWAFLQQYMLKVGTKGYYYISGRRNKANNKFYWPRIGKSITAYVNWGKNQPNNWRGHQDCLALDKQFDWKVSDMGCILHFGFVCKMPTALKTEDHVGVGSVKEKIVTSGDVVKESEKCEERTEFEEEMTMKFTQTDTFRDNYYLIYQYEVNSASQAEKLCQLRGGYLAELNDYDEWAFLQQYMLKVGTKGYYYISGRRNKANNKFYWPRIGKSITAYVNWGKNQPNNWRGHQDCLALYKQFDWKVSDIGCILDFGFVCKMPTALKTEDHVGVGSVKEKTVTSGDVVKESEKCEERPEFQEEMTRKFTQTDTFRDNYYLIYQYNVNSASQAEKLCQLRGGYLAELNDYDEWAFLQQYMLKVGTKGYYYISGRRNKANNKFYWPRTGKSITAYVNWGKNQPNVWRGHQDCLALDKEFDWKVSDIGCILDFGFVCKMPTALKTEDHVGVGSVKEKTVTSGDVVKESEKCEERTEFQEEMTRKFTQTDTFRDNYYLIYQYNVNSASQAEKLCQLRGGYLAELNDYDEWAFLQQYMRKVGTKGYYYISGRRNKANNKFYWPRIGKSITAYVNWGKNQPNNWRGHQDCLALDKQFDWKVSDIGCILDFGFVCKMPTALKTEDHVGVGSVKEKTVTSGDVVKESEKCEERPEFEEEMTMQFTQTDTFRDNYYLIYQYNVNSASQAEKLCQLRGGYLAELNDYDEWAFLQQYMRKVGTKEFYYISGRRNKANNKFYWPRTGKSITAYVNWGKNQPNNWRGHQDCFVMDRNFDWKVSDIGCILDFGFVCKIPEV